MKREELIAKGYTEEQATELLNLFHAENNEIKANNTQLQKDLNIANNTIAELNKVQVAFKEMQQSQMTEQEKVAAMKVEAEKNLAMSKKIVSRAQAKTIFAEIGGIDDAILDTLVSEDLTQTEANAKALVDLIKSRDEATAKKTKEDLANINVLPNPSNVQKGGDDKSQMTKDEFNKLSREEKTKIFKEDKALWDKMTK
jgi:hypothetical protein